MLTEIFQYLRNWFVKTKYFSTGFVISDGVITFDDGSTVPLIAGQYYRIIGSVLNNGVHKYGDTQDLLRDEVFSGAVWAMAVPPAVVALAGEITTWTAANADAINSPYQSESFGGYSCSLKAGSSGSGSGSVTWQSQFADRLAPWRKI